MNRLEELQRGYVSPDHVAVDVEAEGGKTGEYMNDFFGDVEFVKSSINIIKEATAQILDINEFVNQASTPEKEQERSHELEPLIKTTNKKASITKTMLQRLREDTEKMKGGKNAPLSPEVRIRDNLVSTLTRKFVDVMKEYQNSQTKYKTDIKKKVKRQVQTVKPDATTEEIDTVFKSGSGSAAGLIVNSILLGDASDAIKNAYVKVAEKYQDVLTLEASVAELHQMFLDFALLVEQQGQLLEQIEHQVKEASEYIDQGNQEMVTAIELQKSIRRKQCCILMFVLIVIGIIIALVVAKVKGGL